MTAKLYALPRSLQKWQKGGVSLRGREIALSLRGRDARVVFAASNVEHARDGFELLRLGLQMSRVFARVLLQLQEDQVLDRRHYVGRDACCLGASGCVVRRTGCTL